MGRKVVGIGDYCTSSQVDDSLVTYALASCVAVTVYSREKKVAGMIHIALPKPPKGRILSNKVGYYATTGLPVLFRAMLTKHGCLKEGLEIRLYGGANSICEDDVFYVGQKNLNQIEALLKEQKVPYQLVDVGGNVSRTIEMDVLTGQIKLTTQRIQI